MKQFLRYQISGTTFMFWLAIFGFGSRADGFHELASLLYKEVQTFKVIAGLAAALPVGVLIHQFSVLIKNWVIGRAFNEFSDMPNRSMLGANSDEMKSYILERISNLNSFYYIRVDNGLLAPLFAWFVVSRLIGFPVPWYLLVSAFVVAVATLVYLPRIHRELEIYLAALEVDEAAT